MKSVTTAPILQRLKRARLKKTEGVAWDLPELGRGESVMIERRGIGSGENVASVVSGVSPLFS